MQNQLISLIVYSELKTREEERTTMDDDLVSLSLPPMVRARGVMSHPYKPKVVYENSFSYTLVSRYLIIYIIHVRTNITNTCMCFVYIINCGKIIDCEDEPSQTILYPLSHQNKTRACVYCMKNSLLPGFQLIRVANRKAGLIISPINSESGQFLSQSENNLRFQVAKPYISNTT